MEQEKQQEVVVESVPPTGMKVVLREFKKDKIAMFSFIFITALIIGVYVASYFFIDIDEVMKVKLLQRYTEPGVNGYVLGADEAGRDILMQLIIGAKNSIYIAISVTLITSIAGIMIGLAAAYYGGIIDNIIMRIIDFFMTLPTLMIIIVMITIIPKYTPLHLILVISLFGWVGTARLVRSKVLSEAKRDYVNASKTMGTSDLAIMFKGILPNLSSILIVELTLSFAGNVGIETGLSFLGFGLPPSVPSLGTLVSYATNPVVLAGKWWVWLPASLFILVMMLGINYVGQALRRAADARQRLG